MNVNKLCVQCNQIVYPLEQLKCLDQVWHRRCFRCETCGMALNMGNYRGYEKKPYCSAHYPQPKRFTVVADTPEFQRVAQNTRMFSSVNYNQRNGAGGTLDRPGKPRSATTVESLTQRTDSSLPSGRSQQQQQRHNAYQLYSMGQSLPCNEFRHENGSGRLMHSSCSASPGHVGLSSEQYNSFADTHSAVHSSDVVGTNGLYQASPDHLEFNNHLPGPASGAKVISGLRFRAMYDYQAKEDDEVSFVEGDIILHGDPITEGWMYGTIQRTGQFGMLPSNYVEPVE